MAPTATFRADASLPRGFGLMYDSTLAWACKTSTAVLCQRFPGNAMMHAVPAVAAVAGTHAPLAALAMRAASDKPAARAAPAVCGPDAPLTDPAVAAVVEAARCVYRYRGTFDPRSPARPYIALSADTVEPGNEMNIQGSRNIIVATISWRRFLRHSIIPLSWPSSSVWCWR